MEPQRRRMKAMVPWPHRQAEPRPAWPVARRSRLSRAPCRAAPECVSRPVMPTVALSQPRPRPMSMDRCSTRASQGRTLGERAAALAAARFPVVAFGERAACALDRTVIAGATVIAQTGFLTVASPGLAGASARNGCRYLSWRSFAGCIGSALAVGRVRGNGPVPGSGRGRGHRFTFSKRSMSSLNLMRCSAASPDAIASDTQQAA